MRRSTAAILLVALALISGGLGWGMLSGLWADYQDSRDSFYVLTGVPFAAISLASLARLLSLFVLRGRRVLLALAAAASAVAFVIAIIAGVSEDEWELAPVVALLVAVVFWARPFPSRPSLVAPTSGARSPR